GETDPRYPDTDGDGLDDAVDPNPLDGLNTPDGGADAPAEEVTGSSPFDGCTASPGRSGSPAGALFGLVLLGLALRRRRP
ncbi:MAG: hypothetical protein KC583_00530, partial [Myxococcales bacterium]|nr:hypothetical protein [Myxococcales bacterium]